MDDDRGAAVDEERVRVGTEVYILVLELRVGVAFGIDREILDVAGVMALGIVESVLLAFGIEMRTGGFEVGAVALRILMEVDRMFTGRKAVKVKLKGDTGSLGRENDRSYGFALRVFEFYNGFGGAGQRGENQHSGQRDEVELWMFHAGNYSEKRGPVHLWAMPDSQGCGVYFGESFEIFPGKSAIMAVDAVERVTEQVPVDDFQSLEEKVYRTIEMYKAARQAQAAAERDAQRVRQQLEEREEQLVTLRRETVQLKKEREEIRGRVEKMLEQIDAIDEERAS